MNTLFNVASWVAIVALIVLFLFSSGVVKAKTLVPDDIITKPAECGTYYKCGGK